MAKNVILSTEAVNDDDDRLLEDGVFPYTFGKLAGSTPVVPPTIDLAADVAALSEGETSFVSQRLALCQDLLRWHQTIGSPTGFYLLQALSAQSKLLQSCCLRIVTHHPEFVLNVPLYPWLRTNLREWTAKVKQGTEDAAPLEVLVKSLRTWLNLDKGIGVISGESPLEFRSARNGMVLLDKWLGGTEELALSLPQGGNPEDPACPLEAGLPLGTTAISNSATLAVGALYLQRLTSAAQQLEVAFDGAPYLKGSAFEHYALALYDKTLVSGKTEDESALLTYLALSDLALFSPIHPLFTRLRSSQRWNDLHPGHRLARAIEVAKERNLKLESTAAGEYFKFTSIICESLGWPEVPRFLDAVREATSLDGDDPTKQFFKAACALRETHPCAFFDPFEAVTQLGEIAPPGAQLADVETSRDTDQALSFALEAELYAAGFQLFFSTEPPDFACPDFAEVVGLLHSAAEMVQTYFGLELE